MYVNRSTSWLVFKKAQRELSSEKIITDLRTNRKLSESIEPTFLAVYIHKQKPLANLIFRVSFLHLPVFITIVVLLLHQGKVYLLYTFRILLERIVSRKGAVKYLDLC